MISVVYMKKNNGEQTNYRTTGSGGWYQIYLMHIVFKLKHLRSEGKGCKMIICRFPISLKHKENLVGIICHEIIAYGGLA